MCQYVYEFEQVVPAGTTVTVNLQNASLIEHVAGHAIKAAKTHQVQTDNQVTIGFRTGSQTNTVGDTTIADYEAFDIRGVSSLDLTAGGTDALVTVYGY